MERKIEIVIWCDNCHDRICPVEQHLAHSEKGNPNLNFDGKERFKKIRIPAFYHFSFLFPLCRMGYSCFFRTFRVILLHIHIVLLFLFFFVMCYLLTSSLFLTALWSPVSLSFIFFFLNSLLSFCLDTLSCLIQQELYISLASFLPLAGKPLSI